jgi:hypothetical protein
MTAVGREDNGGANAGPEAWGQGSGFEVWMPCPVPLPPSSVLHRRRRSSFSKVPKGVDDDLHLEPGGHALCTVGSRGVRRRAGAQTVRNPPMTSTGNTTDALRGSVERVSYHGLFTTETPRARRKRYLAGPAVNNSQRRQSMLRSVLEQADAMSFLLRVSVTPW